MAAQRTPAGPELVTLKTSDGIPLDAALSEPDDAVAAVVHIHGKGGNFYTGPGRFVPELTPGEPLAHLSINMRCHDLAYSRYDGVWDDVDAAAVVAGGMWEDLSVGHLDLEAAVDFLRARGHRIVVMAGHSSGGFYTADYGARHPEIEGRIFLSPLTGNGTALPRWFPAPGDLDAALAKASSLVADGKGHWLIPLPTWYFAVSAQSLLERAAEPAGIWLRDVQACPSPLLMLWGDTEDRDQLWRNLCDQMDLPGLQTHVVAGADHQYTGYEAQVAEMVTRFALEVAGR